jgi:hypothetical protein
MKTEESTSVLERESLRRRGTDHVPSLAELSPGLTLSPIGTRPTPSFPGSLRVLAHGQGALGGKGWHPGRFKGARKPVGVPGDLREKGTAAFLRRRVILRKTI